MRAATRTDKRPVESTNSFSWKSDVTTVEIARKTLRDQGASHLVYSFYTRVERVVQMLETGCLWLTRHDSELFDDGLEHIRFGRKSPMENLFIKCFQFGTQESAAMWGLYCPPTYKAIRVTISQNAFRELVDCDLYKIKGDKVCKTKMAASVLWVQDIFYADFSGADIQARSSGRLWHDGEYSDQIKSLGKQVSNVRGTGVVKDIVWRFEDEARVFAKTKSSTKSDHVAIKLPASFVDSMSFVLSPWASGEEREYVTQRLKAALEKAGRKKWDDRTFAKSVLDGGLRKWAERRGVD